MLIFNLIWNYKYRRDKGAVHLSYCILLMIPLLTPVNLLICHIESGTFLNSFITLFLVFISISWNATPYLLKIKGIQEVGLKSEFYYKAVILILSTNDTMKLTACESVVK